MIECPFCHVTHVINTIFCDECGQFIGESGEIVTEKFPTAEEDGQPVRWKNPRDTMKINFSDDPEGQEGGQAYPVICLDIGPGKREVRVQLDRPVHIGRLDATNNVFPEIDLSSESSLTSAVSRRHARMFLRDNIVMIEDLDSLNGTYINNERLPPFLPVNIADGDTLKLGSLEIGVMFSTGS
jgi:pSer/pThr/pTyr-binding forkhead associated (FHA) protein